MKFFLIGLIFLCASGGSLDFALKQWKKDGNVEIQDAYKWLFQAALGGEHAVPGEQMAREWLDREWLTLGAGQKDEPLWQPLCKEGSIGRLNLRPYKNKNGGVEILAGAFVRSSKDFARSKENFVTVWNELGKRLKKKPKGKLTQADWQKMDEEMKAKNYPAMHHSKNYNEARKPAYRVVTGMEAKKLAESLMKDRP